MKERKRGAKEGSARMRARSEEDVEKRMKNNLLKPRNSNTMTTYRSDSPTQPCIPSFTSQ